MFELGSPIETKVGAKEKFLERMKLIGEKTRGVRSKYIPAEDHHRFVIFASWIILKAYPNHLQIHAWSDSDTYIIKDCKYNEVSYDCNDLEFFTRLLKPNITTEDDAA